MDPREMIKKQMAENEQQDHLRKKEILTLQKLKDMGPGAEFATGIINEPRLNKEFELRWVAVRGGFYDWTIYYHKKEMSQEFVRTNGDKCFTKEVIRELVPCDDEAFSMYRF